MQQERVILSGNGTGLAPNEAQFPCRTLAACLPARPAAFGGVRPLDHNALDPIGRAAAKGSERLCGGRS